MAVGSPGGALVALGLAHAATEQGLPSHFAYAGAAAVIVFDAWLMWRHVSASSASARPPRYALDGPCTPTPP